jgi:hypothetical protein
VPLRGLRLAAAGRNNAGAAGAVGLTGIALAPLGFMGLAVRGGQVEFPAGLRAEASIATNIHLASLGPAPPGARSATAGPGDEAGRAAEMAGAITIPPPPHGEGQVVFFRRRTLLGTAQWFKVRENGEEVGKLTNGSYFIRVTPPGKHTYTATYEPELKDHLTLEVAPGETYFVEGTVSKALVVGAADLSPSDREAFAKAANHLRLAREGSGDRADEAGDGRDADAEEPANRTD